MKLNDVKSELMENNRKHNVFSEKELENLINSVYSKISENVVENPEITYEQKKHIKVRYVIEREKRKIRARKEAMKQKNKEV